MIKPIVVTDVDLAFGGNIDKLLPALKDIPEKFKKEETKWNDFINKLFFNKITEIEFVPKDGVDVTMAMRHIRAVLKSWEPKHEHKVAGCAYLASEFFEDIKYS